jgi:hypothetical protein
LIRRPGVAGMCRPATACSETRDRTRVSELRAAVSRSVMALDPLRPKFRPTAHGSLVDDTENLVRRIRLKVAVKVHPRTIPVILEVSTLNRVLGAVGIE